MKVLKEEKNPLLSRTSLILEEDHIAKKTPSNEEAAKKIAELLKTKPELVKVKHIYSKFGQGKSKIIANVYTSLDKLKEIEEIKKKVKKEKPKEAPKKEAPKEEKKEEVKKEEPKKEEVTEDGKETKTQEQEAE